MQQPSNHPTWRSKLTLAVVAAAVSGAVRAVVAWVLQD